MPRARQKISPFIHKKYMKILYIKVVRNLNKSNLEFLVGMAAGDKKNFRLKHP
jgi:hypothetical protein